MVPEFQHVFKALLTNGFVLGIVCSLWCGKQLGTKGWHKTKIETPLEDEVPKTFENIASLVSKKLPVPRFLELLGLVEW